MELKVFFCHPRHVFLVSLQENTASDRIGSDEGTKIFLVLDEKWQLNAVNAFYLRRRLVLFLVSG